MKLNNRVKSLLGVATATLAMGVVAPLALATPATALDNVGDVATVESRCDNSPYILCLYYNGSRTGAWWGTRTAVRDMGDPVQRFFPNTGAGSGERVDDNSAAISCDASTTSICYTFSNLGYTGSTDFLYGQRSGQLNATYNRVSSVRISFGA